MRLEVNRIIWKDRRGALQRPLTAALVCDVHDGPFEHILPHLKGADMILVAGDLTNRHDPEPPRRAGDFLRAMADTAPTWYSIGNHERRMPGAAEWRAVMEASGAHVLDNAVAQAREDLWIGGLSSQQHPTDDTAPRLLERQEGFRLLLCHHPEVFRTLVAPHAVDLTLAGHAHGGQFRFFGHGLYAPGQGPFPRLTSGLYYDGRLLVSRGTGTHGPLPRLFNPCELILLTLEPGGAEPAES